MADEPIVPVVKNADPKPADPPPAPEAGEDPKGTEGKSEIEVLKESVAKLTEDNKSLMAETISRKQKLKELEATKEKEAEALQVEQGKYKDLYESNTAKIEALEKKNKQTAIKAALEPYAMGLGIKNVDDLKMVDQSSVLYDDEKNTVHGYKELLDDLKKDKPYLFDAKKVPPTQKPTDTPVFEDGTGKPTDEKVAAMSDEDRIEYMRKSREARGNPKQANQNGMFI